MTKPTTTGRKTTTTRRKTATRRKTSGSAPAAPAETVQTEASQAPASSQEATGAGAQALRKKELIERVIAQSGMKKKDVKPVVEATLAVLGEALAKHEDLNLRPMGKLVIQRTKDVGNGEVLIARIRRPAEKPADTPKDPLAEAAE